MSLEDLAAVHQVTVKNRVASSGASMGVVFTPTTVATLACCVQEVSASKSALYASRGLNITNEVFFTADPMLTVNHILLFGTLAMEVLGVHQRCDGDGVPQLWIVDTDVLATRPT